MHDLYVFAGVNLVSYQTHPRVDEPRGEPPFQHLNQLNLLVCIPAKTASMLILLNHRAFRRGPSAQRFSAILNLHNDALPNEAVSRFCALELGQKQLEAALKHLENTED